MHPTPKIGDDVIADNAQHPFPGRKDQRRKLGCFVQRNPHHIARTNPDKTKGRREEEEENKKGRVQKKKKKKKYLREKKNRSKFFRAVRLDSLRVVKPSRPSSTPGFYNVLDLRQRHWRPQGAARVNFSRGNYILSSPTMFTPCTSMLCARFRMVK